MTDPARTAGFASGEGQETGRARVDTLELGRIRFTRLTAPPGWRWSTDMRPMAGTDLCQATHVGLMVAGRMRISYPATGESFVLESDAAFAFGPGHDSETLDDIPAVLIWIGDATVWAGRLP